MLWKALLHHVGAGLSQALGLEVYYPLRASAFCCTWQEHRVTKATTCNSEKSNEEYYKLLSSTHSQRRAQGPHRVGGGAGSAPSVGLMTTKLGSASR